MRPGNALGVRRYSRPPVARRVARAADVFITRTQEWLEGPDKPVALVIGYGVIVVAVVVMVAQVVRCIL